MAGLFAESLTHAQAALTLAPHDPRLLYNLALLHRHMADSSQPPPNSTVAQQEALAEKYLNQAIAHDPTLHQAWATLGHMAGASNRSMNLLG
jgi:hypothetical protein